MKPHTGPRCTKKRSQRKDLGTFCLPEETNTNDEEASAEPRRELPLV
jgi:hypothetical protein